ncbi:MAG: DMT family transporter [Ruminococcaceae bacterium]|nr:DMT family transporter [Oscillospiraceae bacterium]
MNRKQLRASFLLLLCAFVWGSTFVAQSSATKSIAPFSFLAARSFVGSFALLILSLPFSLTKRDDITAKQKTPLKRLLVVGLFCGIALTVASACQQYGMTLGTGAGKAGFLTALYLVFVPLLNFLIFRRSPEFKTILGSIFSLIGLFLLCGVIQSGSFGIGDFITACCGFCFAIHILIIDRYAGDLNGIQLSCVQFFVCGTLSLILALVFDPPVTLFPQKALYSVLYAGLVSSALGYTLQIFGQKDCPPTVATILMSLESVFALLSDTVVALLKKQPIPISGIELVGCLLMFVGVLLAQIPLRSTEK